MADPTPAVCCVFSPGALGWVEQLLEAAVRGAQRNHGPYRALEMGILGKGDNGVLGRLGVRGLVLATNALPSRVGP